LIFGGSDSEFKKRNHFTECKEHRPRKGNADKENIMIEQKLDTLPMGPYFVSYTGKEQKGVNVYYTISYFLADRTTGEKKSEFELKPLFSLREMGNVAEPATKHFLTRDITLTLLMQSWTIKKILKRMLPSIHLRRNI